MLKTNFDILTMNNTKEKILLLLLAGLAFGCSYTPGKQWMVLKTVSREWKKINKKELRTGISYLYRLNFIEKTRVSKNSTKIFLTKKGELVALNHLLMHIKDKSKNWDKKWRMVAFDIPEKYRKGRDALRQKLKKVGFCELQKSVLITPYDCEKEIKELIKFFELEKYVRFGILDSVDNEDLFKKIFRLT
jgi:DNA-binding transcriptional regulator PaaX